MRLPEPKKYAKLWELAAITSKATRKNQYAMIIVISGFQGRGKSCCADFFGRAVAHLNETAFSYQQNLTYLRDELQVMVDGDKEGKGQLTKYSVLWADELISMFYKRNWYDDSQKVAVELFNKWRDRRAVLIGCVPNFFSLDQGFLENVDFRIHCRKRGQAAIYQRDENDFAIDPWNRAYNEKQLRKGKTPRGLIGYMSWPQWTEVEEKEYNTVRNKKRKGTEGQTTKKEAWDKEPFNRVKQSRNELLRFVKHVAPDLSQQELADVALVSQKQVSVILNTQKD